VLAATLAFGVLGALWSVVAPLGEAPDEPAHLALVLHLADGKPYPDYDGLTNQAAIIRLCKTYAAATRACPRDGEEVTPTSMRLHPRGEAPDKADRPAWNDEGGDASVGQVNQMPQHPPLYYQSMAAVLRVERAIAGGPMSTDRELALLRLVNAALLAPLPLLAWWAARRFRLGEVAAVTAAVAMFAVPMLTHIGSTLNNDNLLTLLAAVGAALLAGVLRGDRTLKTAAAVGVVAALALLTKAFGMVLIPAIGVAYLLGSREQPDPTDPNFVPEADGSDGDGYDVRGGVADLVPEAVGSGGERYEVPVGWGERVRSVVAPLAVAGSAVVVLAGWWFVGVRIRTGQFAPTVESARLTSALAPPGFSPSAGDFAGEFVRNINNRFWGSFGWYTIRFPTWLATACTLLVVAAVITALVPKRDESGSSRLQRAALLVPIVLLGGLVFSRAWGLYTTTSKFQFLQGRYLFAGLVGLMVLAAVGLVRLAGRWAPLAVAGFAVLLQAEALRRCLQGWWGGPDLGPRGQVRAMVAWSAWPGELLGLLGLVALGLGAWFAVALVRFVLGAGADLPARDDRPVGSMPT
jgi:small subunit ribosomal protein S36